MIKLLIILGLVIIPFYEIFLRLLPFAACLAPDTRITKEILAMVFALSIGLLAVFFGEMKSFSNKWLLFMPVYLLLSFSMAPHFDLLINNIESGDLYFWKPFCEVLCFSFMIIAVASSSIDFNKIIKIMVICGSVMAAYVILQFLGLDQFFVTRQGDQFIQVHGRVLSGSLGQPTLLASWMVMMVPLAFYLRKYWMASLMIISCLLTQGAMVLISLISIFIISMFYLYKNMRELIVVLLIISISIFGFLLITNNSIKNKVIDRMDGRYQVWKDTIKDIHSGQVDDIHKYPLTGAGFGRFSYAFSNKHKSIFMQTHNDLLEFTYDCGLIGLVLLIIGIFFMFKKSLENFNTLKFSIALSFIAILVCSLGGFPFQLGAHQFYTSLLVGLLNNDSIIRRV